MNKKEFYELVRTDSMMIHIEFKSRYSHGEINLKWVLYNKYEKKLKRLLKDCDYKVTSYSVEVEDE